MGGGSSSVHGNLSRVIRTCIAATLGQALKKGGGGRPVITCPEALGTANRMGPLVDKIVRHVEFDWK